MKNTNKLVCFSGAGSVSFAQFATPLKRNVYILLLLYLSLMLSSAASAQSVARLSVDALPENIVQLEIFTDSTRQLTVSQIKVLYNRHRFRPLPGGRLLANYTTASYWLHLSLPATRGRGLYLEIDNPRINQVNFFQLVGTEIVRQVSTGDSLPFGSRRFSHYNWVFPLLPDAQLPSDVFVQLAKHGEILNAPVRVWLPDAFEQYSHQRYLRWGVLAGITLIILLLNGVVWAATADPLYGWFMAVIALHTFHLGAASGLSFQYLWPTHPIINDWYPQTLSAWFIVLAQVQFMQRFIGQTGQNSRVFRWVNGFKYLIIGATLFTVLLLVFRAVPSFYFRWLVGLTLLFSLLVIPLAIVSLYERRHRAEPIIRFYGAITAVHFLTLTVFFTNIVFTRAGHPLLTFTNEALVVISFLVDLLVLSLGVLYFGFANYRRQNETLLTALHRSEQEQSQRIIDALEMERNRIAEDLYDDVGAMLSTAIGYVSSTLRKPEIRERFPMLGEARSLLDRAVENLRTVSHNLMPKNFAQLGLTKSLAETVDKVSQNSTVQFDYVVVGQERRFDAATEVQLFRIASELINDIVKNSTATQATLQLIFNHQTLNLIAEDNGPRTPIYNNLTSKVNFIQGTLDVDASPTGVTTIIEIPYQ